MSDRRLEAPYENRSKKFYRSDHDFGRQYFHIYESRLKEVGDRIKEKAQGKYGKLNINIQGGILIFIILGDKYPIKLISELKERDPMTCILIGTLFKNMILKPSILKELAEENQIAPLPPPQDYNDLSDEIILEDTIQRIKLEGKVNVGELVSGIVVGVLGRF